MAGEPGEDDLAVAAPRDTPVAEVSTAERLDRTPELEVPAIRVWKYSAYRGDEDPLTFAVIDRVTT